jgi:hypothetical protein
MHHFDARQDDAGATKILEAHHGFDDPFDRAMILFGNVVQVFDLADPDERFPFGADGLQGSQMAPLLSIVMVSGSPFWSMAFSK